MKLDWPDFELTCDGNGSLTFLWRRHSRIESHVGLCSGVRLLPQGSDGLSQWVFHLRFPKGPTPGLLVVRVDVPPDRLEEAQQYTDLLRRRFGVPEHATNHAEEAGFQRVPLDGPEWIAAPASAASEELFDAVTARAESDAG
ncbi:hypothetical protein J2Z21_008019 [Streptomyces griseochromogenes]|uniref:Uncharacterized protein n=1 Tax=Streptomyces griseochromogenes TaxID=68214 RepID=A0A1B1B4L0_9ACTN|nr:hypothetical protein [Streptomyces griseochromogenes]ANP53701.1 hypothetical protein AVL59_32830 [Streptomyces griseochromogenes]MBP2055007.1 hypothetical protein [Streptomyces griseochromogenes]